MSFYTVTIPHHDYTMKNIWKNCTCWTQTQNLKLFRSSKKLFLNSNVEVNTLLASKWSGSVRWHVGFMCRFDINDIIKKTRFQLSELVFGFRTWNYVKKKHDPAPSNHFYSKKTLNRITKLLSTKSIPWV